MPWVRSRTNLVESPNGQTLGDFACTLGAVSSIAGPGGVLYTRDTVGAARVLEVKVRNTDPRLAIGATVRIKAEIMTGSSLSGAPWRQNTPSSTNSDATVGALPTAQPGVWQPYEGAAVISSVPGASAGFVFSASNGAVSDEIRFRNMLVDVSTASLGAWFDGDTPDTDTKRYSWLGTPGDSVSIEETLIPDAATGSDLERLYLQVASGNTSPSLSLADLRRLVYGVDEWAYFAGLSGLAPAEKYTLNDHMLAYYRAQSGLTSGTLADAQRATWA